MDLTGILAIVFIFGGGSMFLLAISPVGKAIAARIQGGGRVAEDQVERLEAAQQGVLEEVEALRRDVGEMQERLDFAERMLAKQRQMEALPEGERSGGGGSAKGGGR
ncbi:MAG TPA: hypothetical protein VFH97_09410 [Gemmatimonadales bacterium]|nr:hypothetical protein [Gemmatimonadales bacterium]